MGDTVAGIWALDSKRNVFHLSFLLSEKSPVVKRLLYL